MSETKIRPASTRVRNRRAFSGLSAALFTVAIGWTALVAITFFSALGRGEGAALWGMTMTMSADQGFELSFDGPRVLALMVAGALAGAVVGLLLPSRR